MMRFLNPGFICSNSSSFKQVRDFSAARQLIQLRKVVAERLPRVELAELALEVALRTGFTQAFTHLTDRSARTADFALSLCAALLAEACNTGPEPFIRHDTPALRRDRIAWVKQNYLRDD